MNDEEWEALLTKKGFMEIPAHKVERGMLVAYRDTMFGFEHGEIKVGQILQTSVIEEGAELEIGHTTAEGGDSVTEIDWEDPVWVKAVTCELCGEDFEPETKGDGRAEMYDPEEPLEESVICHHICGVSKGLVLA